jgi:putative N6-adenine-specific DNA methylase
VTPVHRFQVVATPGLEPYTAEELLELGAAAVGTGPGSVTCSGPLELGMRACLWLRTASRVRLRVGRCRATGAARLAGDVRRIDWSPFLAAGDALSVSASGRSRALPSSDLVARIVREAIETVAGPRPGTGRSAADAGSPGNGGLCVDVRVRRAVATLSVDLSGERLDHRGYRLEPGRAPLREHVAAALLRAAGWHPELALCDPMCGAGTVPIEAALIASRRAPGAGRRFPFEHWPGCPAASWRALVETAATGVLDHVQAPIHGSDRNAGQVGVARRNAGRAGILPLVALGRADFETLEPPAPTGLLITNPPYGRRVTEVRELGELHARIGTRLAGPWRSWRAALVAHHRELETRLERPPDRVVPFVHGGLRCRLLIYEPRPTITPLHGQPR